MPVKLGCLNCVLVSTIVAIGCAVSAQTYNVGTNPSGVPAGSQKSQNPELGWGSNIQNARLARAAQQALQQGDHALALDYAQRAAQAAPSDPQLWFLLGYAARLDGKLATSFDAYTRGLRLNPASLDGLSGLAQTESLMGRTDDAVRLLKQVVSADPKRSEDALLLGDLSMRSADYTGALDWLGKSERIHPGTRSELLMALCYQHLQQMNMADHYLQLAQSRDPGNPEVQRSMAGYFRAIGNYPAAVAALQSIRNPGSDVIAELAYTYQLDGKLDNSAALYTQVANSKPQDAALQLAAAQAEVAVGSIAKANVFLDRVAALAPDSYRLHALRGEIAQSQDREQDAIREYNAALTSLPANPAEGPLYSIQLHMDLMDMDRNTANDEAAHRQLEIAQAEIRAVSEQATNREPYLRLKARISMNEGDLDGALTDIHSALTIDAHDPDTLQLEGDILVHLNRTPEAIGVYRRILVRDPGNHSALIALGYASRALGQDQNAEKYFLHLAEVAPSLYIPYLALGDLYAAQHQFPKAQAAYSRAYILAPQKVLIIVGGIHAAIEAHDLALAGTWLSRVTSSMTKDPQLLREKERYLSFAGHYRQSEETGEQAIQYLPGDRDVVVYLGYDMLHLQQYDQLLALTRKYRDVFPKEPDIPLLEGYVHKHQDLSDLAQSDFTEALKRDPTVVTAYVNRGYMLNDLHQPQAAAKDFQAALQREPDNGEAHLGLAYASLDLHQAQAALRQAQLAEHALGASRDIHMIRATAYGQLDMLSKAADEYKNALKFTPKDGALHLGLGNTYFAERQYHDAIRELQIADREPPVNADVDALLARSYASLQDRARTLYYVGIAEERARAAARKTRRSQLELSEVFVSTGEAFSTLGDLRAAMERFRQALSISEDNRVSTRLAIAQAEARQGHDAKAERQIALALMEADAGETVPPTGRQLIAAADVFRTLHEYQLSQDYLQRAKAAGAPDVEVRIGLANNYMARGDTMRAKAELATIGTSAESSSNYQYLLAKANVFRQLHNSTEALTSFAQASNAEGEDQTAQQALLQAGADEGFRVATRLSLLGDFSVDPIYEDTTVYVLDSKLDALFPVPINDTSLLPPPRSSIQTQATGVFHLHLNHIPTPTGFFQIRNARGQISVPATNSIVNRNTTDYTMNLGVNPTVNLGRNVFTFNGGAQGTIRRDSESPLAMNQNLFQMFLYVSTSSFFNAVSASGFVIREAGPFTESNLHSLAWTEALDFRVGTPWGKSAMVVGWGVNDQKFSPVNFEDYYTSSYLGAEHQFSQRLNIRAVVEDIRAWRNVGAATGNAQNLRPAGAVDFNPATNWNIHLSSAYSSTRSFHVYDAVQNGFSVSYAKPIRHQFNDGSRKVLLEYPIRFSAGMQEEDFFNFKGGHTQQFRPYVQLTLF